jgi:hypothetical protein
VEEIAIDERDLASAWRPEARRLAIPWPRALSRGKRVAVRVQTEGGVVIPVSGVSLDAAQDGMLEIAVDLHRVGAVKRVLDALEGRARPPRPRATRYRLALPAVVACPEVHALMTTFSVSQSGCGLVWSGPHPGRGTPIQVRLGSGSHSATFRGRVAWVSEVAHQVRVGIRFVLGHDAALTALLAGAAKGDAT